LQRANHELKQRIKELEGNNTNLFKQNRKQLKTICQFGGRIEELEAQLAEMQLNCDDSRNAHKTSDEWRSHWQTKAAELEALLKVAKCPNALCSDGAFQHGPTPDGDWIAEQCQWCAERKAIIGSECDEN
jgi:chromosome segregation ATPase